MLPYPVIQRLPQYLSHVMELRDQKAEWVSSADFSRALGFTPSTIRQDLFHLNLQGVSKRGYRLDKLEEQLRLELNVDCVHPVIIIGAGYLGMALALHGDLERHGFKVSAIFDNNEELIGQKIGRLTIRSMTAMPKVISHMDIKIGVLTVPQSAAQEVADQLVAAGIKSILNLAYCVLREPEDVVISDVRVLQRLQELPRLMQNRNRKINASDLKEQVPQRGDT